MGHFPAKIKVDGNYAHEIDAFPRAASSSQTQTCTSLFEIQEVGRELVVRPRHPRIPSIFNIQQEREHLESVARTQGVDGIVFDLRHLRSFSSSFLSLLVVLYRLNLTVSVTHPPSNLREALKTTRLNELIDVR